MNDEWKLRKIWKRRGKHFTIEISHHKVEQRDEDDGGNRWCVYAYIYPEHPHFVSFNGNSMWQDAALASPLHGGPSYLQWHRDNDGNFTSIQVGADYNHLGDEHHSFNETAEDARSVFHDADELFDWLSSKKDKPEELIGARCGASDRRD